ncbi:hypothetical protein BX600DRAFT_241121 [Xylariales sp. PMI_506]|nr:hypothetical protein BX600DRAFT_241121 [Xylariales sp. PMI_506]
MATTAKNRQPRLRASCDGCFLAKVKCSKARPICSRCLACGIECRYSPSSRAGKPKLENSGGSHRGSSQDAPEPNHIPEEATLAYQPHIQPSDYSMRAYAGWVTPPSSVDGSMGRNNHLSSGLGILGTEDGAMQDHGHMPMPAELYSNAVAWSPPMDLPYASYGDSLSPPSQMNRAHARSQSYDVSMTVPMGWGDVSNPDAVAYSQGSTPASNSNHFPSPAATPVMHSRHGVSPAASLGGSCTCFTVCLQSLQALHNASSPAAPPFDLVLSLNRKAVEGCAAMLACGRCMSRSGTHTAAMLLATVMGKITSFYKNASHSYFENPSIAHGRSSPSASVGVSLGVYQLNGEDGRWLELEILARELRKLEEVYARFREVCGDLSEDPEVSKAMIGYLGQNLGTTLEVVSHRKSGTNYT